MNIINNYNGFEMEHTYIYSKSGGIAIGKKYSKAAKCYWYCVMYFCINSNNEFKVLNFSETTSREDLILKEFLETVQAHTKIYVNQKTNKMEGDE